MDADLAARIEANVSHFLLAMGAAGGGVERHDDEVRWTVGGSPIGYHNAVVACDVDDVDRAAAIVEEWRDELRVRGLPGSWHLAPSMRPTTLDALLHAGGFEAGGEEPAMAADLLTVPTLAPTDLVVTEVDDRDLRAYRDVLAAGFGEGPVEADWSTSVFATLGLRHPWHHFLGSIDGVAVATTTLLLTGDVGGIYFVCTHPDHRRQGYGATITAHAMAAAAAAGATHAVLGSSPMGQRIYERLGFRTVFSYRLFETP